jgi:anthranilate phosphoribosyltransferase
LLGVFAERWVEPVAGVLAELGAEHAWVVHGSDGMDELTITGPTLVVEVTNTGLRRFEIAPADFGMERHELASVQGGDARHNAEALEQLLQGNGTRAYHDIVVMNAAAALVVGNAAPNIKQGAAMAEAALRDGPALAMLEQLRAVTGKLAE